MKTLDIGYLRTQISYCPDTGRMTWLVNKRGHRRAGDVAGSATRQGYRRVKVRQVTLLLHRAAWALHFGEWPATEVDHVNGVRDDNRISNLRLATRHQNCQNVPASGCRFEPDRGKWLARICVRGSQKNLGRFDTEREAKAAYRAAAQLLRGDFARD